MKRSVFFFFFFLNPSFPKAEVLYVLSRTSKACNCRSYGKERLRKRNSQQYTYDGVFQKSRGQVLYQFCGPGIAD